jgi:hypothetical protein
MKDYTEGSPEIHPNIFNSTIVDHMSPENLEAKLDQDTTFISDIFPEFD